MSESPFDQALRSAITLREIAECKAAVLSHPPSGVEGARDAQVDALADLAEVVLSLVMP